MFLPRNQNGVGLIAAIIAAALVVSAALAVSYFIVNQNKSSVKLSNNTNCVTIASSISDYIRKDDNAVNITNFGPALGQTQFASNLDTTIDGYDRFSFQGNRIEASQPTSGNLNIAPASVLTSPARGSVAIPDGWSFSNYLNIRNSTNRLIALASNGNFCCEDLDLSDTGCGADLYVDGGTNNPPSLTLPAQNVRVKLAINIEENGSSLCSGGRLSRLPDLKDRITTKYVARVILNENQQTALACESEGSTQIPSDTIAPYTIVSLNYTGLCDATKTSSPSACSASNEIQLTASTVVDRNWNNGVNPSCQTCLRSTIGYYTCAGLNAAELNTATDDAFNTCTAGTNSPCLLSDPGSLFLCRVGEMNWFNANPNFWEPCHSARVRDFNGNIIGDPVEIEYLRVAAGQNTDTYSRARITLRNLPERAYQFDIRAVDTKASFAGPSFCSTSDCSSPAFVVNTTNPTLTQARSLGGNVDVVQNLFDNGGTSFSVPAAMAAFGASKFQCQGGVSQFETQIQYPSLPAGAYPLGLNGSCTSTLVLPNATSRLIGTFEAQDNLCRFSAGANPTDPSGNYVIRTTFTNECNRSTPNTNSESWCYDRATPFATSINTTNGSTPTFALQHTKPCALAKLCPRIDGASPSWSTANCPATLPGWSDSRDSGCLRSTSGQYCMLGFDPCGRSFEASTAYESHLLAGSATTNKCVRSPNNDEFDPSTVLISGNMCESGWCDNNFKCVTTNANIGRNCDNSGAPGTTCDHTSDCSGSPTTCNTTYNCELPTGQVQGPVSCTLGTPCTMTNNSCDIATNRCTLTNDDCTSTPCPTAGTCRVRGQGTCQEPTNRTCSCEPGEEVFCPVANTCLVNSLAANPAGRNSNCTPLPPLPPACEWVETSRTPCSGACGQAGTLTINRTCRVVGTGAACGTCTGSSTVNGVACTSAPCATGVPVTTRAHFCFVKDTEITLANGGIAPIQDIKVGDWVTTYDEIQKKNVISQVTEVAHHPPEMTDFFKIDFTSGKNITVTGDHYIFSPDDNFYIPVEMIYERWKRSGDFYLLNIDGKREKIQMIYSFMSAQPSYNLHVKGISSDAKNYGTLGRGHNYFANGILAHNMKWVCQGGACSGEGCPNCMSMPPMRLILSCDSSELTWLSVVFLTPVDQQPYTPPVNLSGAACTSNPVCNSSCASTDGSTANMGSQYCVTPTGPGTCIGYLIGICFCPAI